MGNVQLAVGTRIAGRYVVRGLLGEGGMGQVFEVENEAVDRRFALKVLRIDPLTESALGRFRREAKAVGRLASSRVVQVIDSGVDDNVGPYMVMELLFGETLDKRLMRDARLSWQEAAHLVASLCDALGDVHDANLVHRDLKPSNVGLPSDGPIEVKLLDFGLAASMVEGAFTDKLTQSQQLIGTLPYMAPEQFHNAPVTSAVDLYAVGIMLFEMLAGRRPFVATSVAAYVQMHLFEPPPTINEVAPDVSVPPWLSSLVLQLLSKEAHDRPESARDVAEQLRAMGSHELDRAERPTARAYAGSRDVPTPQPQRPQTPPSIGARITTPKVVVRSPTSNDLNDTISDVQPPPLGWKKFLWPAVAATVLLAALALWQLGPSTSTASAPPPPAASPTTTTTTTTAPTTAPTPPVAKPIVVTDPVTVSGDAKPREKPTSAKAPPPRPEKKATLPAAPAVPGEGTKPTWKGEVITDPDAP